MSMKKYFAVCVAAGLSMTAATTSWSQQVTSYPVDMSAFWNVDGYLNGDGDDAADPILGDMFLDDGGRRIRSWTFPADFVDGQPNYTQDGLTQFLLGPVFQSGEFDAYRPVGDTIPAPEVRAYDRMYLAVMSGNGEFPGSAWAGGDVMTLNYADGTSEEMAIGVVNDWFWSPPEWYVPASGDPGEIVIDLTCYDGDPNEFDSLWDWSGATPNVHTYGQYRFANGEEEFITYRLPYEAGATLYMEMWGNVQVLWSLEDPDFDPEFPMEELYNSATEDQVYPGGGDGYQPNRQKFVFDNLDSVLPEGTTEFYLRFRDAAPGQATTDTTNWGARIHRIGLFTGPVELSSTGDRLFSGLVRDGDGAAPDGGLILIRKSYRVDNTKSLESVTMPTLTPNAAPFLTVFGVTFGVVTEGSAVSDYSIY